MPFLGSTPADKYQSLAKQTITGDGSTAYTLNRSVTNAYDMEVFINNVRQEPDTSYSASGNTITFTAAITGSDSCYLIYQGQSVGSINPPAASVGTSQIANNTVTTAHLHTGLSVPDSNIAAVAASKLTGNVATANMPAGAVIKTTRWTSANFNGSTSSTSFITLDTLSLTATPGNLIYVSGAFPSRGSNGSTWQLTIFKFSDAVSGDVWEGGYHGVNTYEGILSAPISVSYIWAGAATHNVSMHVQSYSGTRYYGTSNQTGTTTTPVITIMEIAQ